MDKTVINSQIYECQIEITSHRLTYRGIAHFCSSWMPMLLPLFEIIRREYDVHTVQAHGCNSVNISNVVIAF